VSFFGRLSSSLKGHGLRGTWFKARVLLVDYLFDLRYGVETCSWSELGSLTIDSANKEHGYSYQPTRVLPLRIVFRSIRSGLPEDAVLVDIGSGKGRVLLVASEFGFKEARGIEFAHELCEVARKNVGRYKQKTGVRTEFQIIETDATQYLIKPEENLFIMYNPFDETVLDRVLDNIIASLRESPRKIWIVYYNPKWNQIVESRRELKRAQELNVWGFKFAVYSNDEVRNGTLERACLPR
jgi:SAM-dependent methyltransferase